MQAAAAALEAGSAGTAQAAIPSATPNDIRSRYREVKLVTPLKRRGSRRRALLFSAAGVFALLLLAAISIPNLQRSRTARMVVTERQTGLSAPAASPTYSVNGTLSDRATQAVAHQNKDLRDEGVPSGPMIIRSAALEIIARDFENARAATQQIVSKYQGYFAGMNTTGQAQQGRHFTATIRVPAAQLDAAMAALKQLGTVTAESQTGEEVTQQYVDLVARLKNSRHTEQRLVEVLQNRTGKVADILEVEREIARVREQIEQMEAQRKLMENQVRFATLQLALAEEYQKPAGAVKPTGVGTLLWNSLVDGGRTALDGAIELAAFVLRVAPSLLLWGTLLAWPARKLWRHLRPRFASPA